MTYEDFIMRIGLSLLLGFLIGLERQITGHFAGIRINVLICLGTSFFILFPMLYGSGEVYRIASYIVSGVGFLCSGVIFKDAETVRGINTAATLWCTAAVGILASTGEVFFAISAAGVLIGSNLLLRPLAEKFHPIFSHDETEKQYRISVTCREEAEEEIRSTLITSSTSKNLFLNNLESSDINGAKVEIYAEYLSFGKNNAQELEKIVRMVLESPQVVSAGWEVL